MAENSVIISAEEEAKLLKPIDEYVEKIQKKIDALRVDGSDKVNDLKNQIAIAKENKNLSKIQRDKIIENSKKELESAKKVEKKRTKTNMAYSVCMAFITVVFVISLFAQYQVKLDLNAQEKDVKIQLSQQEKIKKRLTNEADNQDSPEVIEKIAREKLNMVKPNEIVFVDDNQDENTTSSPLTTTSASTSDGE